MAEIRAARPADAGAIAAIYAHHVVHGTATFDTEAPDLAFWSGRIAAVVGKDWPFLVEERDGAVAG